jgi:hypothetical protein
VADSAKRSVAPSNALMEISVSANQLNVVVTTQCEFARAFMMVCARLCGVSSQLAGAFESQQL